MTPAELAIREAKRMAKSPFTDKILNEPKPEKFLVPKMKAYEGKTDLVGSLVSIQQVMILETINENLLCKVFLRMLAGTDATWFNQLELASISNFSQLADKFVTQFHYNSKEKKTMADLMNVKMKIGESLKAYLDRFTHELNQCEH